MAPRLEGAGVRDGCHQRSRCDDPNSGDGSESQAQFIGAMTSKDPPLDGLDFRLQVFDLHQDQLGAGSSRLRKLAVLGESLELWNTPYPLGSDQAKLSKLTAQRIDQHDALSHEQIPGTM